MCKTNSTAFHTTKVNLVCEEAVGTLVVPVPTGFCCPRCKCGLHLSVAMINFSLYNKTHGVDL